MEFLEGHINAVVLVQKVLWVGNFPINLVQSCLDVISYSEPLGTNEMKEGLGWDVDCGGFGFGSGLARGSRVVGGGSCARGPSSDDTVGREKRVAIRVCAPSRAVDMRYSSSSALLQRLSAQ